MKATTVYADDDPCVWKEVFLSFEIANIFESVGPSAGLIARYDCFGSRTYFELAMVNARRKAST